MEYLIKPGKMLIILAGRHKGERYVAAAKAAGARGGTLALGPSIGGSALLQALFLADVQQDVVLILMGEEADAVIRAVKEAGKSKKFGGTAVVVAISGMVRRGKAEEASGEACEARSKTMESGFTLITAIVNHGYADDIMAAARKAGASGGTILNARGAGTEEDVKFFGITLVPEKEMVHIVAEKEKTPGIIEAISATPNLSEPGGGIVFTQDVAEFIHLGG